MALLKKRTTGTRLGKGKFRAKRIGEGVPLVDENKYWIVDRDFMKRVDDRFKMISVVQAEVRKILASYEDISQEGHQAAEKAYHSMSEGLKELQKMRILSMGKTYHGNPPIIPSDQKSIYEQYGIANLKRGVPRILRLQKEKTLQVERVHEGGAGWTRERELELLTLMKEAREFKGKKGQSFGKGDAIAELRSMRKEAHNVRVTYSFIRGPYMEHIDGWVGLPEEEGGFTFKGLRQTYTRLRRKISHERRKFHRLRQDHGQFGRRIGLAYPRGGSVGVVYKQKKISKIRVIEKPTDNKQYVGIELEFCAKMPNQQIKTKLYDAGIYKFCNLHEDHSLRTSENHDFPHELAMLVPAEQAEELLKKAISVLKRCGAYVNRTCSVHVHLDMRSRPAEKCFRRLVLALEVLFAMTPTERKFPGKDPSGVDRTNYCRRNPPDQEFDPSEARSRESRYWAVNPHAMAKYQTIEIRLHPGSLNVRKISNWVNLLTAIADTENKTMFKTPERMVEVLKLSPELSEYVLSRVHKFQQEGVDSDEEQVSRVLYRNGNGEMDEHPFHPKCGCGDCVAAEREVLGTAFGEEDADEQAA